MEASTRIPSTSKTEAITWYASAEDESSSRSMANHIGSTRNDNIGRICHGIVDASKVMLIDLYMCVCMCMY